MNNLLKLIVLFFVSFILTLNGVFAQRFIKKKKYLSAGATLNAINYVGELDPGSSFISPSLRFTKPNFGATVTYRMAPRVSVRGTFSWGRLKGDDAKSSVGGGEDDARKIRNYNFRSNIWEIKGDVIIDLFENRSYSEKRPEYTPYGFIGLAFFRHNPKTFLDGKWQKWSDVNPDNKYSLNQIAIPFGLGFRYKLAKNWDLAFEVGWRFTFTDNLDGVQGDFPDPRKLSDIQKRAIFRSTDLAQFAKDTRGYQIQTVQLDPNDPTSLLSFVDGYGGEFSTDANGNTIWISDPKRSEPNRDWYIVTGFHLTYIFPRQVVCPKFRY